VPWPSPQSVAIPDHHGVTNINIIVSRVSNAVIESPLAVAIVNMVHIKVTVQPPGMAAQLFTQEALDQRVGLAGDRHDLTTAAIKGGK
jgi:hypothetical protein